MGNQDEARGRPTNEVSFIGFEKLKEIMEEEIEPYYKGELEKIKDAGYGMSYYIPSFILST